MKARLKHIACYLTAALILFLTLVMRGLIALRAHRVALLSDKAVLWLVR